MQEPADPLRRSGYASSRPPQANVGSPGTGTLPHLLEAMLMRKEGVAWQHMTPASSSPAVLAARIAEEQRYWQAVLRADDIHAD